jgi:hypothetical protein
LVTSWSVTFCCRIAAGNVVGSRLSGLVTDWGDKCSCPALTRHGEVMYLDRRPALCRIAGVPARRCMRLSLHSLRDRLQGPILPSYCQKRVYHRHLQRTRHPQTPLAKDWLKSLWDESSYLKRDRFLPIGDSDGPLARPQATESAIAHFLNVTFLNRFIFSVIAISVGRRSMLLAP